MIGVDCTGLKCKGKATGMEWTTRANNHLPDRKSKSSVIEKINYGVISMVHFQRAI